MSKKKIDMSVNRIDSKDKDVCKYVFDFGNAVAEAVLYKYPTYNERTVICCSTQSGCPVGCRFCGAGDAFVRSLTSEEIIAQIDFLFNDKGINPKEVERGQIMFMSMGEPLLNMKALRRALYVLNRIYPNFSLLISTSAPDVDYTSLINTSIDIDNVGLQFSVHESTDENRNKLVPFKKKLSLKEISETGEKWHQATGRSPFFNYCTHESNTSDDDAERLYDLFDPNVWQATISVICERDESVAAANERQRSLATGFMEKLNNLGFSTRCFNPAGQDDIGGGCGQLWFVQDWMRKNNNLARPSIGNGYSIIHAPKLNKLS